MDFLKVTVYTNSLGVEPVTSLLYDMGIVGVQIMDKDDFEEFTKNNLRAWDIVDEELSNSMMNLETAVSFYLEESEDAFSQIKEIEKELVNLSKEGEYGRLRTEFDKVKNEDWENNWKKYYHPIKIGERIIIKPTWEDYDKKDSEVVVELDPGMAFGTGSHASTHMCLEFLEKTVRQGDRVFDIGTGSGILAITALKLGAESAKAVDIDPCAVKIAKENALLNGYSEPVFKVLEGNLDNEAEGEYDIVIANIVADVICDLTKTVGKFIKKDGKFITSGIIDFKADKVRNAICEAGLKIVEEKNEKDWYSFLCERM